ncbi:MAG: 3-methylornithine--L-lysine ligase PylC, partial [Bacillota bacterium]|nr:3-methylornithine--L-lysine ligase PylC [Bacillota bacterium]
STGTNMLAALAEVYTTGQLTTKPHLAKEKAVIYEHIAVSPQGIEVLGEHIMAQAGPIKLYKDFFGADEVLTNYSSTFSSWVATLMTVADNTKEVWQKRNEIISSIMKHFNLSYYLDKGPEGGLEHGGTPEEILQKTC